MEINVASSRPQTAEKRITEFYVTPPYGPEWGGSAWIEPLTRYCETAFPGLTIRVTDEPVLRLQTQVSVIPLTGVEHPTNPDAMMMLPVTDETHSTMAAIAKCVQHFDPSRPAGHFH
ncbi:hypothetical protein H9Q09_01060 [Aurantimonas sp. DM33-3]|uniref:hypothetical protein n=1 Tax=Aurantimonas sp. DM33-3 TaxID=2766955 RepID=UPI001651E56A|nr:hypothetical protein [Aurantimonas sp. DM33-3]MBC6714774.1 hypothetical protein [Aurantimonas sp. DM33-3]